MATPDCTIGGCIIKGSNPNSIHKIKRESAKKQTLFYWHAGRDFFSALPCLSPRFARCHVGKNSPLDCFLPQIKDLLPPCSNPFLLNHKTKKEYTKSVLCFCGTPEGIRTPDLLVRSQTLYPAELPAHTDSLPPEYNNIKMAKSQQFF